MKYEITAPILDIPGYPALVYVEPSASIEHKLALTTMARYFKSEFGYDHLQYDEFDDDAGCVGVLFCDRSMDVREFDDHPNYVVGGGCFRTYASGAHFLDWIWLHPFARHRGTLRRHWPMFRSRFGAFSLTSPLSHHMSGFVAKYGS